jgi:hypothetical protein
MKCKTRYVFFGLLALTASLFMMSCSAGSAPNFPSEADSTPAEDSIGERLFLDTRFAQFFALNMTGVNQPLPTGDPAMDLVFTMTGTLPGPFAGQSINCRSCHFVTEFQGVSGGGNRTYSDYTTRSPLPRTVNSFDHTPRNSMQMVGSLQPHDGPTFLHFDGEFATPVDLVASTMTGRNFGWAPDQHAQALAHIARIIREDDGSDQLAKTVLSAIRTANYFSAPIPEFPWMSWFRRPIALMSKPLRTIRSSRWWLSASARTWAICCFSRMKSDVSSDRHTTYFCASIISPSSPTRARASRNTTRGLQKLSTG